VQLPRTITAAIRELERLYAQAHHDLEAFVVGWSFKQPKAEFSKRVKKRLDQLDVSQAVFVRTIVGPTIRAEYREAERLIGVPVLPVTEQMVRQVEQRLYQTLAQQTAVCRREIQRVVEQGYKTGMTLEDRRAFQRAVIDKGIVGLVRSDGSRLGLEATGKAIVRTQVNQLQAESQIERYKAASVAHVQFQAGGPCTFKGTGGTCTELDGHVWPIDSVPDWARIPRHLYSNSRWLPVVERQPDVPAL
jgi:hypothetical protein